MDSGAYDPAPLIDRLRTGHYGLVQTGFDVSGVVPTYQGRAEIPRTVAHAIQDRYCQVWESATAGVGPMVFLYEPCDSSR